MIFTPKRPTNQAPHEGATKNPFLEHPKDETSKVNLRVFSTDKPPKLKRTRQKAREEHGEEFDILELLEGKKPQKKKGFELF